MLSSTFPACDGSGPGRHFCVPDGDSILSAGRFHPLHRFRVLPGAARAKMQSHEHRGIGSIMRISGFRLGVHLVPADHRERNCWFRVSLILMKRAYIVGAVVVALLAAAVLYLYGGGQTPAGQPPLKNLSPQSVGEIKNEFNAAKDDVRILLLLSPT